MTRYNIAQTISGDFVVQVRVAGITVSSSPNFETEAEADAWIVEDGKGTEYTVSRGED